jgi:tetratricopeptide (TPR) repeat protein
MDMNILIKAGFFIRDLDRHIKQLHSEQFNGHHSNEPFIVYRGQGLSKADFERMSKTKGGLMSFNSFLSTQKNRNVSLDFTRHATTNPDLMGILFVMTIDPSKSTAPIASVADVGTFSQEAEVLFSTHTVFRIGEIKSIDGLFQVNLTLTSDTDDDLRMLTDHLRKEICQHSNGWYQLGLFLLKMGQIEAAQDIYEMLLKETSDEREKGNLFHQLGSTKVDQGKYDEAIKYFEKSLVICEKTLPQNHPHLASSFNNIGLVYEKLGEYSKALESHEKALRIYQKIRPPNHPDLVSTYNNMGLVYNDLGDYPKALSFHEKALEIRQKTLPPNHPDLAMSYNNIGLVRRNMGDFSEALSLHERAVNIAESTLPSNHPALQMYKKNLEAAKKKL